MAWSINKAFILGNVTRDPELRSTPNGTSVTSFGVATNRRWKDPSGAVQEETQFHEVVAWAKTAELITQILKKGTKVAVIGRLQTHSWDAPDGSKRSRTEIVLDEFVPLTPKGTGPSADYESSSPESAPPAAPTPETGGAPPVSSETSGTESVGEKKPTKKATKAGEPAAKPDGDEINLDDIPF